MKFNYKTFLLSTFMLAVSFVSFASPPLPTDGEPGEEDPPASINTKLIWLAIVGLAFAYYQFKNRKRIA